MNTEGTINPRSPVMNAVTKPEAPATPAIAVPSTAVSNAATTSTAVAQAPCRVLKIATCPSLSGKSTLTYHIGCAGDGEGGIQFRVVDNTNIGFFSQEWVPYSVIQGEFDKIEVGKTITSFLLHALFRGRSVNTPAFLFAVLLSEGLVQHAKDSTRQYDHMDPKVFLAAVQALIASRVELKVDEPVKAAAKSGKTATVKTKAAKVDAVVPKVDASPSQTGAKPATGVDIAGIVEVINAKVGTKTKAPMPAKKANAQPKA
jgi:hypothetical protein